VWLSELMLLVGLHCTRSSGAHRQRTAQVLSVGHPVDSVGRSGWRCSARPPLHAGPMISPGSTHLHQPVAGGGAKGKAGDDTLRRRPFPCSTLHSSEPPAPARTVNLPLRPEPRVDGLDEVHAIVRAAQRKGPWESRAQVMLDLHLRQEGFIRPDTHLAPIQGL
jgi:hypothetical protein